MALDKKEVQNDPVSYERQRPVPSNADLTVGQSRPAYSRGKVTLKFPFLPIAVLLVGSGCAAHREPRVPQNAHNTAAVGNAPSLDLVSYRWSRGQKCVLQISFSVSGIYLSDPWAISERRASTGWVWDVAANCCSKQELILMLDRSLARFLRDNPNARFDYVALEAHIVRDLWADILAGLGQQFTIQTGKMEVVHGAEGDFPVDYPPGAYEAIERVLNRSSTVAAIKAVLKKHGMEARTVGLGSQFIFNADYEGKKWADIAKLPGLGIELPGVIEFDMGADPARTAQPKD